MLQRLPNMYLPRQPGPSAGRRPGSRPLPWPRRPDAKVLSPSIPLFFISRDSDGFWVACDAEFRVGGSFFLRRSAVHFAQRHSAPTPCATMILEDLHELEIDNSGNRLVDRIRRAARLIKGFATRIRLIAARLSRAYIEERMLRAAMEVELYRGRYKHSNKNDDDLPIVAAEVTGPIAGQRHQDAAKKDGFAVIGFAILAAIMVGIVALRLVIFLPRFP